MPVLLHRLRTSRGPIHRRQCFAVVSVKMPFLILGYRTHKRRNATDCHPAVLLFGFPCADLEEALTITLGHQAFRRDVVDFGQRRPSDQRQPTLAINLAATENTQKLCP